MNSSPTTETLVDLNDDNACLTRTTRTSALPETRSASHASTLSTQQQGQQGQQQTPQVPPPPRLPPRAHSFASLSTTASPPTPPPPLPRRRQNPLYPLQSGPRFPSTLTEIRAAALARTRQLNDDDDVSPPLRSGSITTMSGDAANSDNGGKPVDIRARVAAFEQFGSGPGSSATSSPRPVPGRRVGGPPPPPPPRPGDLVGGQEISRVHSTPRTRPGDENPSSTATPDPDPLAEFGALSPQMRFGGLAGRGTAPAFRGYGTSPAPTFPPSPASASSASLPVSASHTGLQQHHQQYSASPHGSASLSPVSAHRAIAASSPSSTFDLYASSVGSVRRQASGTSLRDFTSAQLRAARDQGSRGSSPSITSDAAAYASGAGGVSGKVPLPSGSRRGSPSPSREFSLGRESAAGTALPSARSLASSLYARTSTSSPHLVPGSPVKGHAHHRSSVSSTTSSSSTRGGHPLDDDEDGAENGGGYGLSLHPALQPTASPVSSRAPSRASMSSRSAPASPKHPVSEERGGLAAPFARPTGTAAGASVRLHPPTPSPERRPAEAVGGTGGAARPLASPRPAQRARSIDSTSSSSGGGASAGGSNPSTSPTIPYAVRKRGPALPPRASQDSHDHPVSYAAYNPDRRASSGSATSATGTTVPSSKVPLPPPSSSSLSLSPTLQRSAPAPAPLIPPRPAGGTAAVRTTRHTPSHSTGSSPADSPLASPAAFGHRSTKSGPGHGLEHGVAVKDWPVPSSVTTLQPPPTRTAVNRARSSSMGPAHAAGAGAPSALPTRKPVATQQQQKRPQQNVFHGNKAYQAAAATNASSTRGGGGVRSEQLPVRPTRPAVRSIEPRDEVARERYEALWASEAAKESKSGSRGRSRGSSAKFRGRASGGGGGGGVATLAQRFEGMGGSAGGADSTQSTGAAASGAESTPPPMNRLPPRRIKRIWTRSRLPTKLLAQVWDAAVAYERQSTSHRREGVSVTERGLSRETFVRSIAAIDAELQYRSDRRKFKAARRKLREQQQQQHGGGGGGVGDGGGMGIGTPSGGFGVAAKRSVSAGSPVMPVARRVPPPARLG